MGRRGDGGTRGSEDAETRGTRSAVLLLDRPYLFVSPRPRVSHLRVLHLHVPRQHPHVPASLLRPPVHLFAVRQFQRNPSL